MAAAKKKPQVEQAMDFLKAYWMPIGGLVGGYFIYRHFFGEKGKTVSVEYPNPPGVTTITDQQAYAYALKLYTAMKGLGCDFTAVESVYNAVANDIYAVRKVYDAFTQVLKDKGDAGNLYEWISDEYFYGSNYKIEENWYALLRAANIV